MYENGTALEVLVGRIQNPSGIAVDPVGGNVYWADMQTSSIRVVTQDGSHKSTLITSAAPTDIVLDVSTGYVAVNVISQRFVGYRY